MSAAHCHECPCGGYWPCEDSDCEYPMYAKCGECAKLEPNLAHSLQITIPGRIAASNVRIGRCERAGATHYYPDPKVRAARDSLYIRLLMQVESIQAGRAITLPWPGPASVTCRCLLKAVQAPKWKRAAQLNGRWLCTSRPDRDNQAKTLCDALKGLILVDDAQIFALHMLTGYGVVDRVELTIQLYRQAGRGFRPVLEEGQNDTP